MTIRPFVRRVVVVVVGVMMMMLMTFTITTAAFVVLGSTSSTSSSSRSKHHHHGTSTRTTSIGAASSTTTANHHMGDTPPVLPSFDNANAYLTYMNNVAALPQGFATGTASGTFIPLEAPSMGALPIRATILHITAGPTHSWAAVYTKNKVRDS